MDQNRIEDNPYNRNYPEQQIQGSQGAGFQQGQQNQDFQQGRQGQSHQNVRKSFRDSSPDEVREMMKERVAKGIAAVTGVLEGFIDRSRSGDVAGKARDALHEAGHTTRETVRATSEEIDRTRQTAREEHIGQKAKEALHNAGSSARSIGQSGKEELQKTSQQLGGQGQGLAQKAKEAMHRAGDTARSIGKTTKEEVNKTKQDLGGQKQQGSSQNAGSQKSEATKDVPDLRHSELGTQEDIHKKERGQ